MKVGKSRENEGLGLVKVIVNVELVACRMVEGLKARATWKGEGFLTVRVAEVVLLGPARAEVMEKLVVKVPRVGPFTGRLKVHEAPPASGDPLTVRLLPSMDSVVTCNGQVVGGTEEEATGKSRPGGRATEKVSKARGNEGLGLVKVIVRVEFVVCRIVEGLKARATANGLMTVSVALAVFPSPPLVDVVEAESLKTPVAVAVMFTTTVQVAPPERVALAKEIDEVAAVAVTVPEQVEDKAFGVATTSPVGSVSENATPVSVVEPVF